MKKSYPSARRGGMPPVFCGLMVLSLWSASGCQVENLPPTAVITSPVEGAVLYPATVNFYGQVGDPETPAEALKVSFYLGDASCDALPAADGSVSCSVVASVEGEQKVELWVADEQNLRTETAVTVFLRDEAPSVTFSSPLDGTSGFTEKSQIELIALVTDPDDLSVACTFSSDVDGELGSVETTLASGLCSVTTTLSGGVHSLTVSAQDAFGKISSDAILLPILGCTDADADGYSLECDGDCNDADPFINPLAIEICDRKDNNCNGSIDDAPDSDLDGFTECTGDCDDSSAQVYPNAVELCDGRDNNCVLGVDEVYDLDKDGFASILGCPPGVGTDCDDFDPGINPGAYETCDDFDENCNGEIDEGAQTAFFADLDGDSFGDPGNIVLACSQPVGAVNNASDCDDTAASINPGGVEACNGKDDDCDGTLDEGTTPLTFYTDGDGDGYGVAGSPSTSGCVPPTGYAAQVGDCNDEDSAVSPGTSEVCDLKDNDCDAQIDENVIKTFYSDGDLDGYGAASGSVQGCTAPSGYVEAGGDCNDANAGVYPGAVEQCDGKDNDCNGKIDDNVATVRYYRDADGDTYGSDTDFKDSCSQPAGYVTRGGDCNDASATSFPGAAEVCDSKDNDCDGTVDEGVQTQYWQDKDKDTYGNKITSTYACSLPVGYSTKNTDCNDDNNTVYPGATETCDGNDNDCDGTTDEGFPQQSFYKDADGDTYGNPSSTRSACAAPYQHVSNNLDCNDADATINPSATEVCDGKDQDCDGKIDDGTACYDDDGDGYSENQGDCNDANPNVSPGIAEVTSPNGVDDNCNGTIDEKTVCWDDDRDGYLENASATTCPGYPGAYGSTIPFGSDCNDADSKVYPGAPERFNGRDDDCDGQTDDGVSLAAADVILTGDLKNAQAGWSVAGIGDVNGDGISDLGVGAPRRDVSSQNRGSAFIVFGRQSGWTSAPLNQVSIILDDDATEARAGFAIAAAGDLDSDGIDDFAVGSPYRSIPPGLNTAGRMYLLYGKSSGWASGQLINVAAASADGIQNYVYLGYALGGGYDVNEDGYADLALGGPWPTNLAWGFLMVLPGRASRYSRSIAVGDLFSVEGGNGDALGSSIAMMPNAGGSSTADLLVGGFGTVSNPTTEKPNAGVVYFIPGSSLITPAQSPSLSALGAVSWRGENSNELLGESVAAAGDINGDGFQDLLVGRRMQSSSGQAQAYLILGNAIPASGLIQQVADGLFVGENGSCPCSVGGVGDVDGDGFDDFAIGVTGSDEGGLDSGAVYLFYGGVATWTGSIDLSTADVVMTGVPGEMAGTSISGVGDINYDGNMDFLIGSPFFDVSSSLTDAGRVFVMFGF